MQVAIAFWSRHLSLLVQTLRKCSGSSLGSSYELFILAQEEAAPNPDHASGLLKELWAK